MYPLIWFVVSWVAGIATILGSLMMLGSLILLLLPPQPAKSRKDNAPASPPSWQNPLKLLAFSLAIAIAGIIPLWLLPFPMGR